MKIVTSVFLTLILTILGLPAQGLSDLITATAYLDGPSESPPVPSPGTGFARVIFDTTARTLSVSATFEDLLAPTTAAHIHGPTAIPLSGNAGVITMTPSFVGFPLGVTTGSLDAVYDTSDAATWNPNFITSIGGTVAGAEAAFANYLLSNRTYFNIHSSAYPGGEIRGFLVAPAPATLLLLGTGLAALVGSRRRRRQ